MLSRKPSRVTSIFSDFFLRLWPWQPVPPTEATTHHCATVPLKHTYAIQKTIPGHQYLFGFFSPPLALAASAPHGGYHSPLRHGASETHLCYPENHPGSPVSFRIFFSAFGPGSQCPPRRLPLTIAPRCL